MVTQESIILYKSQLNRDAKIHEIECSNPYYYKDGKVWEHVHVEFIPDLYFYRYEDSAYSGGRIHLNIYRAFKETPSGFWFTDHSEKRWTSKKAKRKFCYDTKKDAWDSFAIRKDRQLEHILFKKAYVENVLDTIRIIEKEL